MAIADKLLALNSVKNGIKLAIEAKGVTVGSVPFAEYSTKIAAIETGIDLPDIGDAFEGGYFCGVYLINNVLYAYAMAPSSTGEVTGMYWGPSGTPQLADLYDGMANQIASNQTEVIWDVIDWAGYLTIGGYNDWFVPAIMEQQAIFAQIRSVNNSAPFSLQNYAYWSSTAGSGTNAQGSHRNGTEVIQLARNQTIYYARAVRRVPL